MNGKPRKTHSIPPEAMEVISDVLLVASGSDGDRPTYTEEQLARKQRRASRAEVIFGLSACPEDTGLRVPEDVPLTREERAAIEKHLEGLTTAQIAADLQVTIPTVRRMLRTAARRISAHRLHGLRSIYRAEIRRHGYRRPTHCSEQPCKRLGYCKWAHKLGTEMPE